MPVRKRGGRWYYDFMIRGTRYKAAIPEAQNKQQALTVEAQMRQAVFEGRYGREARSITLEKFITDVFLPYSKTNRKRHDLDAQHCARFSTFFKGRTLQEIPPMMIEKYKKWRKETPTRYGTPRRASTINLELSLLSRIFNLAIENGYTSQNPLQKVRRLKGSNPRERYMTEDEEAGLRAHLTGEYADLLPIFDLALNTGMRVSEILGLRWQEIDLASGTVTLPPSRTKEGKEKTLPLNPAALGVLSALHTESSGERVFGSGYELSWVERRWRAVRTTACVPDLRLHDLRHTFATRLSARGVTERTIMALLGHASLRMTTKYTHSTEASKREAVESLCSKFVPEKRKVAGI